MEKHENKLSGLIEEMMARLHDFEIDHDKVKQGYIVHVFLIWFN